ncbi:MAG: HD domain-containing protein [Armatimonadia bacterium]|nr:HD domain-containing protein [Armatimonadia bacterium]
MLEGLQPIATGALVEMTTRGFPLYHLLDNDIVLFCEADEPLDATRRQRLAVHDVEHLYVRDEDTAGFYGAVASEVISRLGQTAMLEGPKAEETFELAAWGVHHMLDSPTVQNLRHGCESLGYVGEAFALNADIVGALARWVRSDPSQAATAVAVAAVGTAVAKEHQGLEGQRLRAVSAALLVHDIGMTTVPDRILNKAARLGAGEMQTVRLHVNAGLRLLRELDCLTTEMEYVVGQHHERLDGSGYPNRLRGRQIHPLGLIGGISDTFAALISDRPYRPRNSPYEALTLMRDQMLDWFGADLFRCLVGLMTPRR